MTKYFDIDKFKLRSIELGDICTRVKENNVYETLSNEFKIGKRLVGYNFVAIFGIPIGKYISNNMSIKNKIDKHIRKSKQYEGYSDLCIANNKSELTRKEYYDLNNIQLSKIKIDDYHLTSDDYKHILVSQYFGDGHFERGKGLSMEHCEKQLEYLKLKAKLVNIAFPWVNKPDVITNRTITDKRTGKIYYSHRYRIGETLKNEINDVLRRNVDENIRMLTPLNMCLYYLDDGYLCYNIKYGTCELGFSTINSELKKYLIEYFKEYGFYFNINEKTVSLQSKPEIIKFINKYILPFDHMLPECMKYKYDIGRFIKIS